MSEFKEGWNVLQGTPWPKPPQQLADEAAAAKTAKKAAAEKAAAEKAAAEKAAAEKAAAEAKAKLATNDAERCTVVGNEGRCVLKAKHADSEPHIFGVASWEKKGK